MDSVSIRLINDNSTHPFLRPRTPLLPNVGPMNALLAVAVPIDVAAAAAAAVHNGRLHGAALAGHPWAVVVLARMDSASEAVPYSGLRGAAADP